MVAKVFSSGLIVTEDATATAGVLGVDSARAEEPEMHGIDDA